MNWTALGGPSSGVVRGLLAAKTRSPSDCAPSAAIQSGRATVKRYVAGAPPATALDDEDGPGPRIGRECSFEAHAIAPAS